MRLSIAVFTFVLTGCAASAPFEGPDWDREEVQNSGEGPFLVIATHTRVARGEIPAFGRHVEAIKRQQDAHPGFVTRSLRSKLPGRERWTMTVWKDEESVMDFAVSGAHLAAVLEEDTVIDGVYSAAWWIEAEEMPPKWSEALDELRAQRVEIPW